MSYRMPNHMIQDFLNILSAACANGAGNISDEEIEVRVADLGKFLERLMAKYLSDSPGPSDKMKFGVALFEAALKLAKGEPYE